MSRRVQGLRSWLWQRISALYLLVYVLFVTVSLFFNRPDDYDSWYQWVTGPVNSIALFTFFLMLTIHAWIGIRDVVMDYVQPLAVRASVLMLVGLGLLFCLIWLSRVLVLAYLR